MMRLNSPKPIDLIVSSEHDEESAMSHINAFGEMIVETEALDESFRSSEISRKNREVTDSLIAEVNQNVISAQNVATIAARRIEVIHSNDPLVRIRELHRGMDELLNTNPGTGKSVINRLVEDDAKASERIRRPAINVGFCTQLLMPIIGALGLVALGVVINALDQPSSMRTGIRTRKTSADNESLDETPFGHRLINLTSLTMEAAADLPGHFQELGISTTCYANLRQSIIDGQANLPESLWWKLLADQALRPYPDTKILQTPTNHYMALAFCLDILQPLYPAEPFDLDIEETVEALAASLNLNTPTCMATYYSGMVDFIPEESGINRVQRIFLARAGLARALSRWQDPADAQGGH